MSDFRPDGSVASANLPKNDKKHRMETEQDSNKHLALITDKFYIDDRNNITRNHKNEAESEVTYEIVIVGGELEGQVFANAKMSNSFGSQYNYSEKHLRKSTRPISGFGSASLKDQTGDLVYIEFISGNKNSPLITGFAKHTKNAHTESTKSDGPRFAEEFHGIKKEINKDGEVELIKKGGLYNATEDYFNPNQETKDFEASLNLTKDQKLSASLGKKENEGDPSPIAVDADPTAETLTFQFKTGLIITVNGIGDKVEITTKGESKVTVDGATDKVDVETKGGAKISIDGNSDKVVIDAGAIELGEGATEKAILGDLFKTYFDTHNHPSAVGPTGTPIVVMPPTTLSNTVKVKN